MKAWLVFFIYILFILTSCSEKKVERIPKYNFTSFEISSFDGATKLFSFSVDTSKIFIARTKGDSLKFGILPDSIFQVINRKAAQLFQDKSVKSNQNDCYNCPIVSVLSVYKSDTVRILQKGIRNDKLFFPIIESLEKYLDSNKIYRAIKYDGMECFETMTKLIPPPPPREHGDVRFQLR